MELNKLLKDVEYTTLYGDTNKDITDIIVDSRKIIEGCAFVCIEGFNFDTHTIVEDVVSAGATSIIVEKDVDIDKLVSINDKITIIKTNNTRIALSYMSIEFFERPMDKLKVIGITGTKGKTTTAYMVQNILQNLGHKVGLIGTIEVIFQSKTIPAVNTTPESYTIQKYLKEMLDEGIDIVVMEVSSQAYLLHRVAGMKFDIGVFTNLASDHIGEHEHPDFANYLYCKSLLFQNSRVGIGNVDDKHYKEIFKDSTCEIKNYGITNSADFTACDIELFRDKSTIGSSYLLNGEQRVVINTPGLFGIYNSLCALAICSEYEQSLDVAITTLRDVKVKGRVEILENPFDMTIMIDYAHNAMALESLLSTIKEYTPKRLVCLFGCGGNRDNKRRSEMGKVSGKLADLTIITSDNPRHEEPDKIIDDIEAGIKETDGKYLRITDRIEAIRYAIENRLPGDILVLAGKGHEDYQIIGDKKYPMDERIIVRDIINDLES